MLAVTLQAAKIACLWRAVSTIRYIKSRSKICHHNSRTAAAKRINGVHTNELTLCEREHGGL